MVFEVIDNVFRIYNKAGFMVKYLHVDPELSFMQDTMLDLDIQINITLAKEHVPDIERPIRVIKERVRSLWHRLPNRTMSKIMIKVGVLEAVRWLNAFPLKEGVSTTYSPQQIMTGMVYDYHKHCKYSFGT
jgi:hypothetical protein